MTEGIEWPSHSEVW